MATTTEKSSEWEEPPEAPKRKLVSRDYNDLPNVEKWPHKPLFYCFDNVALSKEFSVEEYGTGALPIGKSFDFESEVFKGKAMVRFRGLESSNDRASDDDYFAKNPNNKWQFVTQGHFKEDFLTYEVMCGVEYIRPVNNIVPQWIFSAGEAIVKTTHPDIIADMSWDHPMGLNNIGGSCSVVRVDIPGAEPDIGDPNLKDELSLLGGEFGTGKPVAISRRKQLLTKKQFGLKYSSDLVCTFEWVGTGLDVTTFKAQFMGFTFSGADGLNHQPIQNMSKLRDGRYLWKFQVWHEDLLPKNN